MHPDDTRKAAALAIVLAELTAWLATVGATEAAAHLTFRALWVLARPNVTGGKPLLLAFATGGLALAIFVLPSSHLRRSFRHEIARLGPPRAR